MVTPRYFAAEALSSSTLCKMYFVFSGSSFQMSGSFPVSKDLWKISCRIGDSSLCKVCRTLKVYLLTLHIQNWFWAELFLFVKRFSNFCSTF